MPLEDEEFDLLAGGDENDESAAESVSELETEHEGADNTESVAGQDAGDVSGDQAPGEQSQAEPQSNEETQQGQQVPLAVLLEERKSYQSRIDELNQKAGKFDAFMERYEQLQAEKNKPEPEPEPDYLDDPKAYVDHKTQQAAQAANETKQNVTELRQMTEAQQQIQQVTNRLTAYDAEFVKGGKDDYYDALDYVRDVNIKNGLDMGLDEQTAATEAAKAIFMTQAQVMANGKNPAEYMYNLANRWGYKATEAEPGKPGTEGDDAVIAGQMAQGMGGGEAPDPESDEVEELDDEVFAEAFKETFGVAPR